MRAAPLGLAAVALLLGLAAEARADFMTPAGLNPGDQFRIIFVSSTTTTALSANVANYDSIVTADAASAGLTASLAAYSGQAVTWQALVSTPTVSAISRLPDSSVPLYLADGTTLVADSSTSIWSGTRYHAINEAADGALVGSIKVWTGTNPYGNGSSYSGYGTQLGASNSSSLGVLLSTFGYSNEEGTTGIGLDNSPYLLALQSESHALYGYSSPLTVPSPATAVPAPPSLTLLGIGGLGFAGFVIRLRRRCQVA